MNMDELKFFSGLAVVTAFVIAVFIYFGRKLSRAAEKNAAHIDLPLYVSRTGTVLFACLVAFWVYCVSVRALTPESTFGQFLGTAEGVVSVVLGSCVFVGVAWVILEKLGYPPAKWEKDHDAQ